MRPAALVLAIAAVCAGCGLDLQSPDLFLLTRAGQGKKLTILVNDSGTVSCNGRAGKSLSDPLLLQARDLATSLDTDAKEKLTIAPDSRSVYKYTMRLQDGTISFPDTAGVRHSELAQAELLAVRIAEGSCGLSGQ